MGKAGRGEGRPASGDRSGKREKWGGEGKEGKEERERYRQMETQKERWKVGRALLKGNLVNAQEVILVATGEDGTPRTDQYR